MSLVIVHVIIITTYIMFVQYYYKTFFLNIKFYFQVDAEDNIALWGMITYSGGICQQKLDSKCTHLITTVTEGVGCC